MAKRKAADDGGAEQVTETLHAAQEQGYIGERSEEAPSFESQTVQGVLAGQNVEEAPEPEQGAQAGAEA